jgi:hypothetical protein
MSRGLGQVLFNYLPESTLDYDKGSCICKVAEVRINTEKVKDINKRMILGDIRKYIERWGDKSELKAGQTFEIHRFAFGEPTEVLFNIYPLVFECRKCRAAFSYKDEKMFLASGPKCRFCGGRLGQIYHVLVHHCGSMVQLWVPKCKNNPNHRVVLDDKGSQKTRDFRWKCAECNAEIMPINRNCKVCKGEAEEGSEEKLSGDKNLRMRPIPHRANAAFYTHHVTRVNVGKGEVDELLHRPDGEQILVDAYLKDSYAIDAMLDERTGAGTLPLSVQMRRKAMETPEGEERKRLLEMADWMEQQEAKEKQGAAKQPVRYGVGNNALKELFEYVKLRGTSKFSTISDIRAEVERRQPGNGRKFDLIEREYVSAGFEEIKLVADFPIVTSVFGYTRVSVDPVTTTGEKTTFRHFPTFQYSSQSVHDKIPIFVRAAETEALFVRLDPMRLVCWAEECRPGTVRDLPKDNREARLWLLRNVGEVDRFVTPKDLDPATRLLFGIVHTVSHMFIRAAASLAGIDRTGLGEYLFPRMGAFVVYNSNTVYNLGGLTTLFEEELRELLNKTRFDPLAKSCVYDPVCSEHHESSCHACTHLGEMACAFFNRGMSREFLYGADGFWKGR